MALKQIDHGSPEYLQMVTLRDNVLRKPLGLSLHPDELKNEKDDIFIVCTEEDNMLGCCILTKITNEKIKLRQMAVADKLHGKGIGASIMQFAETIARDKGYKIMTMHARDSAIGFYEKFGYVAKDEEFMEVNLPHHAMEKALC